MKAECKYLLSSSSVWTVSNRQGIIARKRWSLMADENKRDSTVSAVCVPWNDTCHIFCCSMFILSIHSLLRPVSEKCSFQERWRWRYSISYGAPYCLPLIKLAHTIAHSTPSCISTLVQMSHSSFHLHFSSHPYIDSFNISLTELTDHNYFQRL
jgi:hypothetical protein